MNILHSHIWLATGGIEAIIVGLCNEMVKRHDVTFLSIYEPLQEHVFEQRLSKKVTRMSCGKKNLGIELGLLWKIYKKIEDGKYDVVHIHGNFHYYLLAILLLHNRIKFVYTVHSDAKEENTPWGKELYRIKRFFFKRKWMQAVTISKASKKSFLDYYGFDNSILVYNGTPYPKITPYDLSAYRFTHHTRVLLHPGRISEAKNQIMLCKNCRRLIDEGYDICLLIAGPNRDDNIMESMRPYFSERIVYLGERNDVTDMMNAADAFCLSSKWEGMPVTLLEALAVGCIPVCTPVGGIPEAISDGVSGLLSESNSEEDYYMALKRYLDTPDEKLQQIKEAAKQAFAEFDIVNSSLEYEKLYMKMLK